MASVGIALILIAFSALIFYFINLCTYWKRRGIPYEPPYPLVGNFAGVGSRYHMRDVIQRLYRKFKGHSSVVGTYLFVRRAAIIMDLDVIKHILIKEFSNFHDRGMFNNVEDDPLMGHLVTLQGDQWRAMRTKLTPVFTSAKMKYMFPTVVKVGENFAQVVGNMSKQTPGQMLELKDLCARYTTDVIGTCVFGIECNSLKDPNAEFRQKGKSIFTERRHYAIVEQFILTNPELAKRLHAKILKDEVSDFFMNAIRETVEYRLNNNIKRNDFLDLLIELKAKDEQLAREAKGIDLSFGLTMEQLAAQTFVFFVAGFETSSSTIAFCLHELARHQEIQDKLRTEILETLKASKGELTYEGLKSMQYLEQVIAETLRCYSVLPILLRRCQDTYHIPDSPHVIEKNTTIIIPVDAIHHDPEYYEEPNEFRPERFTADECEKRHSCAYLPFGEGPRNCIGSRFGKMQTKIGLISLLRQYRVGLCDHTKVDIDNSTFLVTLKDGIVLRVTEVDSQVNNRLIILNL